MTGLLRRYARWLHTGWPAGTVEKLPVRNTDGTTAVPGVRVVGDLTGIPLLKFASDTGATAIREILKEPEFARGGPREPGVLDVAIVGGGVSGIAASLEAKKAGLSFEVFESTGAFSTVVNFPVGKPIFTYPKGMTPAGGLQFEEEVHPREELLASLQARREAAGIGITLARIDRVERSGPLLLLRDSEGRVAARARRVVVAIGRSGSHRRLGVPGEESGRVFNRLFDPKDFAGREVLVVGGGDSALEAAIALAGSGARVVLSYRRREWSRPRPENVEKLRLLENNAAPGSLRVALGTEVVRIDSGLVTLRDEAGRESAIPNDVVFAMIGREAPLYFFRRS